MEKLEKIICELEGKLTAAKKELEAEKSKAAVQTKPEGQSDATVGQEKSKRAGWW